MKDQADPKVVAADIARRLAAGHVDRDVVQKLAHELAASALRLKRIDICQYGICWDHVAGSSRINEILAELLRDRRIGRIEVFPWGIPVPDEFRLHVEQRFEAK